MTMWSELPKDVAINIVENLEFHEDFTSFSAVCSRWRSAAKEAKFRACIPTKLLPWSSLSSPSIALPRDHHQTLPYLMLPEPDDISPYRRYYSLCHRSITHLNLPPFTIRQRTNRNFPEEQRFLSSHGWLLIIIKEHGCGTTLSLFNPFNGSLIELPTLEIFSRRRRGHIAPFNQPVFCFHKFILSDDPCTTSDFSVALIVEEPYLNLSSQFEIVSYWRNGDDHWVQLKPLQKPDSHLRYLHLCSDIIFYKGEFHVVDEYGDILAFGLTDDLPRLVAGLRNQCPFSGRYNYSDEKTPAIFYLVESTSGRLLLLSRVKSRVTDGSYSYYQTTLFRVFEVDVEIGDAKEVHDLKGMAVFVGTNSSFSIEASPTHGCKANCIYFADDFRYLYCWAGGRCDSRGKDSGIYNLTTGEVESYFNGVLHVPDNGTPHMWLESPPN